MQKSLRFDDDGRAAVAAFTAGLYAQAAQGRKQVLDGPLAHTRNAVQAIGPATEGAERCEKTHGRAGIGHEKICGRGRHEMLSAMSVYTDDRPLSLDDKAESAQTVNHDFRVFTLQGVPQHAGVLATLQRGQHQGPVRNALGAWNADGARRRSRERLNGQGRLIFGNVCRHATRTHT